MMSILMTLKHRLGNRTFKKFSRSSNKVTSTILMIFVSLLPYTDIFLDFFINTKDIKLNAFNNLSVAIWSCIVCIQSTLVLGVSKLNPWPISYLVLIYVNLSMLLGFLFLEYSVAFNTKNINFYFFNVIINSDNIFRGIVIILALILYFIGILIKKLWRALFLEEKIDNQLEELNYEN